jgi:hypothetical protein
VGALIFRHEKGSSGHPPVLCAERLTAELCD